MSRLIETRLQRLILITAVVLLVSLVVAPIVLAVSQTWYLTDNSDSAYLMQKGSAGGGFTEIPVTVGGSQVWMADEIATTNVGFLAGTWSGDIKGRTQPGSDNTGTVDIGVWDGLDFYLVGGTSGSLSFPKKTTTTQPYTISASAFDVPKDQWLALRFNCTAGSKTMYVQTDGGSWVQSPSTDPGYPVLDVDTLILFASGLAVLGFVFWKLRKKTIARPNRSGLIKTKSPEQQF